MSAFIAASVAAQIPDDVLTFTREAIEAERDEPLPFIETPPTEWNTWAPDSGQFRLYVNYDVLTNPESIEDTVPRIDVLGENGSWPYVMAYDVDTLYIFLVPPGYRLRRSSITVDQLPLEFPVVVTAGSGRAVYWFSNDQGEVLLEPIEPGDFLSVAPVQPLPAGSIVLLLPQSDLNSKVIKSLMKKVCAIAIPLQLDGGFYEKIWPLVHAVKIQTWDVNQLKNPVDQSTRVLLVLQPINGANAQDVRDALMSSQEEVSLIGLIP
jgi:hypothetical protein